MRPYFSTGFSWHQPDVAHLELADADAWWGALNVQVAAMLRDIGCDDHLDHGLLDDFRRRYTDPAEFCLLPDARAVLDALAQRGWRQLILSNHVPELPEIVRHLGLADRIEMVLSSAHTGYEKPNPAAFHAAVQAVASSGRIWMIGDSLTADAQGASVVGLSSILVGGEPGRWPHAASNLRAVLDLVGLPDD